MDIGTLRFTGIWELGLPNKAALMQIGYLADHQEFIPTLAHWHHHEWAYLRPGDSFEARMARLRECCGHHEIPTVIIAFTGGTLLGSAMLIAHDMDTRRSYRRGWLAFLSLQSVGASGSELRWSGASSTKRRRSA